MTAPDYRLVVCVNPVGSNKPSCAGDRGSEALADALEVEIKTHRINARIERRICLNRCLRGPAMRIAPGGRFFLEVSTETVPEIIETLRVLAGTRPDEEADSPFGGFSPGS